MNEHPPSGAYIEFDAPNFTARIWISGHAEAVVSEIAHLAQPHPAPAVRTRAQRTAPKLTALLDAGVLAAGQKLTWQRPRLGEQVSVTVTADGQLAIPDGTVWPSPFQAAYRIAGYPANGWELFKTADGQSLADLKTSLPEPAPHATDPKDHER